MKKLQDILDYAMVERFELAFKEMQAAREDVQEAVKRQRDASIAVHTHLNGDEKLIEMVESYFDSILFLNDEFSKYLYMQGAKDCVAILRELGVIK